MGDSYEGIRGGTKFYQINSDQDDYQYDESGTNENIDHDQMNYDKTFKVVSPQIFQKQKSSSQMIPTSERSQISYKQPNYQTSQYKPQEQQVQPNLNRVEERLLLMGRRTEEKLKKQREAKYSEIMRPIPLVSNKENKPRGLGDVYERLFASSKKSQIESKLNEQGALLRDFNKYHNGQQIGLERVIKAMPEYVSYQERSPLRIQSAKTPQSPMQKQQVSPALKDLQEMVFQSYMNQSKNYASNNSTCNKFDGSRKQQSTKAQQKGIINQCMEAYLKKQKNKLNKYLQ